MNSAINIDIGGNKILQTISKKPYTLKKIDKFKYIKIKKNEYQKHTDQLGVKCILIRKKKLIALMLKEN